MSKFLLNLLVQISKALVYSKIKFYSEKNFSVTFGPSGLSTQPQPIFFSFQPTVFLPPLHWGSASQLAQPTLMAQPATLFLLPHRSQARTAPPAGLAPPPRSTPTPPPEEKNGRINPPFPLFNHR
jgi:hypothetical protein